MTVDTVLLIGIFYTVLLIWFEHSPTVEEWRARLRYRKLRRRR